jgi:V/A-type H+-transporting ATPase subunit K
MISFVQYHSILGGIIMINIITAALVLSIIVPFGVYFIGNNKQKKFKSALCVNIGSFFSVLVVTTVFMFSGNAQAAEAATSTSTAAGWGFMAAALVTGMSTIGAGIAVASAASAALGALSEDQTIMGKALIFVALAEGIALYGLLISFTILGRI